MKNIFIVTVLLCLTNMLIGHAQNKSNTCLNELKQDANKYWHYNKKTKCYTGSDTLTKKLLGEYQTCLIGKDTSYFIKTFGRLNIDVSKDSTGGFIVYPICPEIEGLSTLQIKFDKKGKIKYITCEINLDSQTDK